MNRSDVSIGANQILKSGLETPALFDANEALFKLPDSLFDENRFDPMAMYDEEAALHTQILKFRRACR